MNNNKNIENDIKIISRRKSKILTSKNQQIKPKKFLRNSNQKATQRSSNKFINELDSKNKINLNKSKRRKSELIRSNLNLNSYEYLKSLLENINEIVISQETDILEAVMGCQQPNNYHVYGRMKDGQLSYILKCREFSSCCMRFCCSVDNRQFTMKIKSSIQGGYENTDDEEFSDSLINIIKDCRCPCICCIRPEMEIFLTDKNKKLGTVENGFSFCDPIFNIYDHNDNEIFYITADCCQCGLICRNNFLGKTDECHFFIYKSDERTTPIGDICKKAAKSMFSIADNYSIILPNNSTPEEKVLLTIAGIMIDYQYFERNTRTK
jgi:hypothetical protein